MSVPQTLLPRRIAGCTSCPRLAAYVGEFRSRDGYWGRPVPGFGDPQARLLILGLAPGAHGANRTGRPFTGDGAGVFLYRALHEHGFATAHTSVNREDGLCLRDAFITNVVKCAPPQNKPLPDEVARCRPHLDAEFERLRRVHIVVALGKIAHDNVMRWARARQRGLKAKDHPFGHGATHVLDALGVTIIDSYHPSRYNVNVGKLTYPMFSRVFETASARLAARSEAPPS